MSTDLGNAELATRLQAACAPESRNIKLPQSIKFTSTGNTLSMYLSADCVKANMQDNAATFEGWALALKRWLGFNSVVLNWTSKDADISKNADASLHYQRFLYRTQPGFPRCAPQSHVLDVHLHRINKGSERC